MWGSYGEINLSGLPRISLSVMRSQVPETRHAQASWEH